MTTTIAVHPRRRDHEPSFLQTHVSGGVGQLLSWARSHRRVISPLLDALCILFIVLLYLTEQTTLFLHLVYITLSVGAFIRGGGLPTLARSTAYTGVMVLYMLHIRGNDDFLEIPMMWIISMLAAGLAQVNENSTREHRRMAASDHLTQLDNRREFDRRLASATRSSFAILAIDVDGLKSINDCFGHEAGDEVLCAVARGMRKAVRADDVVARTGGDEFGAILFGADAARAEDVAERVCEAIRVEAVPDGTASVSVGWATADSSKFAAEVVQEADDALYRAKANGRNRVAGPCTVPLAVLGGTDVAVEVS
jgi:diguanylate cyclase (GGDEF)-like protein